MPTGLITLLVALSPLVWGSTYLVTTEWLPAERPFWAAVIRTLPAGLLLILWSRYLPARNQWLKLLVLAVLNIACFQTLLFIAAYRLPGGIAALIGSVQPILVMLFVWFSLNIRPAKAAVIAALVAIFGMYLLLNTPGNSWDQWGAMAAFVGAISMAAGSFYTRQWQLQLPLLALTGWQLLLGGLLLLPFALLTEAVPWPLSTEQLYGYGYLSLVGTLLTYALWFWGLRSLNTVAVSALGLLSPLMAVILGWLVLDQTLNNQGIAAMSMVLISVLALQWIQSKPQLQSNSSNTSAAPTLKTKEDIL